MKNLLFLLTCSLTFLAKAETTWIELSKDASLSVCTLSGQSGLILKLRTPEKIEITDTDPLIIYSESNLTQFRPSAIYESKKDGESFIIEPFYLGNLDFLQKNKIKKIRYKNKEWKI